MAAMFYLAFTYLLLLVAAVMLSRCASGDFQSYDFAVVKLMPQPTELIVHIDTLANHFSLRLLGDDSLFSPDFVFDDGFKEYAESSKVRSYIGQVAGWPNSIAIASVANQRLEAAIFFDGSVWADTLFIENGRRYPDVDCSKDSFNFPDDPQYCTIVYHQNYSNHQDSSKHSLTRSKRSSDEAVDSLGMCGWASPEITSRLQKWLSRKQDDNKPHVADVHKETLSRVRRAADDKLKVCTLNIQIDTTMWALYMNDFNNNPNLARTALAQLAADLVQGVNVIYRASSFEVCNSSDPVIRQLCVEFIDSDAFLKINSQILQNDYCLAYIISHRQFSGGVMGLAWLGYPSGYVGGVCQSPTRSDGTQWSYNTGIITGNNQGSRVSKRGLTLTMAHEIGHNFGSPHDTTADCLPTGSEGYYIMYPYVNPGNKANNDKFSTCSQDSVAKNLESVLGSLTPSKPNCFRDRLAPVCGNQVVEEKEECDCGATVDECRTANDHCCTPADGGPYACRLIRSAQCSPSLGPCCDPETCQLVGASTGKVCAISSECGDQAKCNGSSATCPASKPKTNATFCASNTKLCVAGECSQSVCRKINYDECQEPLDPKQDASRYCYLSCQSTSDNNRKCLNSLDPGNDLIFKALIVQVGGGKPIKLPPGSPCDNYQGVCDVLGRCRRVNVQGPLARLFSVLTGGSQIDSAGKWLVRYWWVVAICSVVFIAISFCLLKYCSDLLPTSNPKFQSQMTHSEAVRSIFKPSLRRRPKFQPLNTAP